MRLYVPARKHDDVEYPDTVTVYNAYKDGKLTRYSRTTICGVSWDDSKNRNVNRVGKSEAQSLLLIIPQGANGKTYVDPLVFEGRPETYTMNDGDKVILGECDYVVVGEDERTLAEAWNHLSGRFFDHIVTVKSIDVKRFMGEIHHLEVGG